MLPFELSLDHIDTLRSFRMLCCTNKAVKKYLILRYANYTALNQLIGQLSWLPELCPHPSDAWRVHTLLQQIKCRLHRMLGNQTLAANPLVVTPRRAGKTELVGTIAAALLLSNRKVVVVATCRRVASNIMRQCLELGACGSGYSNFIQHRGGWVQCCASGSASSSPIDTADVILIDEAAYATPEVVEVASRAKCTFMISTLTSENNHFSGMCSNPAFNVVEAPTSPWAFLVRWE